MKQCLSYVRFEILEFLTVAVALWHLLTFPHLTSRCAMASTVRTCQKNRSRGWRGRKVIWSRCWAADQQTCFVANVACRTWKGSADKKMCTTITSKSKPRSDVRAVVVCFCFPISLTSESKFFHPTRFFPFSLFLLYKFKIVLFSNSIVALFSGSDTLTWTYH